MKKILLHLVAHLPYSLFIMKIIAFSLFIATCPALTLQSHAQAQNINGQQVRPESIFLSGYILLSEAEKLEATKKYHEAWNKYNQALRYYKTLSINFPEWKTTMVNSKIESTTKKITEVEPLAQKEVQASKDKYSKFVESSTSENGIPRPDQPNALNLPGGDQKRVTELTNKEKELQALMNNERRGHQAEINKLKLEIGKLQNDLRKNEQGLDTENSQTKILNDQINKLKAQLSSPQIQSKEARQKTLDTLDQLTRERAKMAAAPLKLDVQKLAEDKQRLETELESIVTIHKNLSIKYEKLSNAKAALMSEQKLAQADYLKKAEELEKSKDANHATVAAMRDQIKAQATQITGLQAQVNALDVENEGLRSQLTSTDQINKELRHSLASVTLERDKLSELLDLSDSDRTKKAIKEALRLGEELRTAEISIKELQANQNVAQDEMTQAENKLALAKKKIIDLQIENTGYIKRIGKLEDNLRSTQDQIEKNMVNGAINPQQTEETTLLKAALKRITVQIDRRKQTEKLLIDEYQKANIKNPTLTNAILNLTEINVSLTAKESQMIKEQADTDKFIISSGSSSPEARESAKMRSQNQIESVESLAKRCLEKGNLQTAKDIYDEAYDAHGHHYPFFISRGVVRVQLGEFDEAKEIFESGTQLKENNAYTHFMLGYCRFKINDDEMAVKSLERAVHIRPDYIDPYIYLALLAHSSGDDAKAKDYLTKAVSIDPEHKEAQFNLSQTLNILGEQAEAVKAYENALRAGLAPNFEYEKELGIKKSNLAE